MNEFKRKFKPTGTYKENVRNFYTVNYKDEEWFVPMLQYQIDRHIFPQELNCIIKEKSGEERIIQDYAYVIQELYQVDEVYSFKVREKISGYYSVIDYNNLIFRLTEYGSANLLVGQQIEAKILSIKDLQVCLQLVEENRVKKLTFIDYEKLKTKLDVNEEDIELFKNLVENVPFFNDVKNLYDEKDGLWILHAIVKLDSFLLLGETESEGKSYVDIFQCLCIYILEESDILKNMDTSERTEWIKKLSVITQHAEDYKQAYRIMDEGNTHEYISQQLDRLKESEYLYQPERRFRIMMCIFNLDDSLMSEMMDKIFVIILDGNKEHWQAEPFRSAFVDLLELFISEYRDKAIRCKGESIINKMIKAIAIEQLLSNSEDNIDRRLNRATYYRLLSYKQRYASQEILADAFNSIFVPYNDELEYGWDDVASFDALYYKEAYKSKTVATKYAGMRQIYKGNGLAFIVEGTGVTIRPLEGNPTPLNLKSLVNWNNLTLLTNVPVKYKLKDIGQVESVKNYWNEVMNVLWTKSYVRKTGKLDPCVGDTVPVKVIHDDAENTALYCEIVGTEYQGKGWLDIKKVAMYLQTGSSNVDLFKDESGEPIIFEVKVIEDLGYDYRFSMLDVANSYFDILYERNSTIECTIRATYHDSEYGDCYVGVSKEGASCLILFDDGISLMKGKSIKASMICSNVNGQYICRYVEDSSAYITVPSAFKNLMKELRISLEEEVEEQIVEELMPPIVVEEIIGILDRLSVINNNRVQSYSILSVVEILCKMLEDDQQVEYYQKRKTLIIAFDKYEKNGYVDGQKLSNLIASIGEELIENDYLVNGSITKFKILDSLKHKENVSTLFQIRENAINSSVQNAADLAISLLLTERFELPNMERLLLDRINMELGVTVKTSKLRDYGIETQTVEFKSSIVYPAGYHMQASKEQQGAVIMQTLCGFLNSDTGGILYLGVNKSGSSCGIENDLKYLEMDEDGYGRYIHGMIYREMGQIANQCCVDCKWLQDEGYKVYVMNVKPSPELIAFKGQYWIRQDTEKRPLLQDKVERYKEMHDKAYKKYVEEHPEIKKEIPTISTVLVESESNKTVISSSDEIKTSCWRLNIVHDYDDFDNYGVGVQAYLHFLSDWKYKVTDEGIYEDTELSLTIKDEESDGSLVVAYQSGQLLIVPIEDILNKTRKQKNSRCLSEVPFFACPAKKNDEVLTVWRNTQGNLMIRVDSFETLRERHCNGAITDSGNIIPTAKFDGLVACEIVPNELVDSFQKYRGSGSGLGQKIKKADAASIYKLLKLDLQKFDL